MRKRNGVDCDSGRIVPLDAARKTSKYETLSVPVLFYVYSLTDISLFFFLLSSHQLLTLTVPISAECRINIDFKTVSPCGNCFMYFRTCSVVFFVFVYIT